MKYLIAARDNTNGEQLLKIGSPTSGAEPPTLIPLYFYSGNPFKNLTFQSFSSRAKLGSSDFENISLPGQPQFFIKVSIKKAPFQSRQGSSFT